MLPGVLRESKEPRLVKGTGVGRASQGVTRNELHIQEFTLILVWGVSGAGAEK